MKWVEISHELSVLSNKLGAAVLWEDNFVCLAGQRFHPGPTFLVTNQKMNETNKA